MNNFIIKSIETIDLTKKQILVFTVPSFITPEVMQSFASGIQDHLTKMTEVLGVPMIPALIKREGDYTISSIEPKP